MNEIARESASNWMKLARKQREIAAGMKLKPIRSLVSDWMGTEMVGLSDCRKRQITNNWIKKEFRNHKSNQSTAQFHEINQFQFNSRHWIDWFDLNFRNGGLIKIDLIAWILDYYNSTL